MSTISNNIQSSQQEQTPLPSNSENYDMIVFCHLRWEFVYQRPQHIISRLSERLRILFIEEPLKRAEEGQNLNKLSENLHILQPNTHHIEEIPQIISEVLGSAEVEVGWFYSPSFSPLLEYFKFSYVIYDCMDELSLFKGAPIQLIEQEKYLVAHANVVFTGGKSLYESKSRMHKNVICFPSSVDLHHFSQAKNGIALPSDLADIPTPIVGYFGVIDERLDLDLLEKTAKKLPEISFVMIGPLAKIEEKDLPRQNNIHYLGMKSYLNLPNYLKAFDIAMMPFALNDSTLYISPTKTLEYMAAGKPIISTKIKDVVRDYQHCIELVASPNEFASKINETLEDPNQSFQDHYAEILEKTSWDSTVKQMHAIVKKLIQK